MKRIKSLILERCVVFFTRLHVLLCALESRCTWDIWMHYCWSSSLLPSEVYTLCCLGRFSFVCFMQCLWDVDVLPMLCIDLADWKYDLYMKNSFINVNAFISMAVVSLLNIHIIFNYTWNFLRWNWLMPPSDFITNDIMAKYDANLYGLWI